MTQDSILSVDYKGHRIRIEQDTEPNDPREWDNIGTMLCFHRHYTLGDKHELTVDEVKAINADPTNISLPLYLYDHSGLRMKVGSFQGLLPQGHAEFDSGQVGIIYVSKERIREEFGKRLTDAEVEQKGNEVLEQEVKTYDDYLTGNVLGYVIEHDETCEHCHHTEVVHDDSCWRYYGMTPEGLVEECKSIIDSYGLEDRQLDSIIENHQI